jgi:hypothetical protein
VFIPSNRLLLCIEPEMRQLKSHVDSVLVGQDFSSEPQSGFMGAPD